MCLFSRVLLFRLAEMGKVPWSYVNLPDEEVEAIEGAIRAN